MKYLLLGLCLIVATTSYSQRSKRSKKPKKMHYLKLQGGYLFDNAPLVNYSGFNLINTGVNRIYKNQYQGFDLSFSKFTVAESEFTNGRFPLGWQRKHLSIEFNYFQSYKLVGKEKSVSGLYAGGNASIRFSKDSNTPNSSVRFPLENKCLCVGIGPKVDYVLSINKKINFNFSGRMTLFDFGPSTSRTQNPVLTLRQQETSDFEFDVLRNQFLILAGFSLKV